MASRTMCSLALALGMMAGCSPKDAPERARSGSASAEQPASGSTESAGEKPKRRDISPAKRPPLAAPSRLLDRPRTQKELSTTDWQVFIRNLRGQVKGSGAAVAKAPQPLKLKMHAQKLLSLGRLLGDIEVLGEALAVADRMVKASPRDAAGLLLRAQARFALHQWDGVREDVKAIKKISPKLSGVGDLEAELLWNAGKYDEATGAFTALAKERPTLYRVARLGNILAQRAGFEAGDKAFARAETLYRDVSPVPIAWLYVQRALLRIEHGRYREALLFLEGAYERAPGYPMVVEHLAQVHALLGDRRLAAELYEEAIGLTPHPEYYGALAGVLRAMARTEEAEKHEATARARAGSLLKSHPAAAAGHAVEVLQGAARKEALAAFLAEASQRLDPATQGRLAEALIDDEQAAEALTRLEKVLTQDWHLPSVYWTAARAARLAGEADKVKPLRARALELNPEIEAQKGPI